MEAKYREKEVEGVHACQHGVKRKKIKVQTLRGKPQNLLSLSDGLDTFVVYMDDLTDMIRFAKTNEDSQE